MPFSYETGSSIFLCISLSLLTKLPNVEVGEGNTGGSEVTVSTTASHTIQPSHVNTAATPQRSNENHVIESWSKSANVSTILTSIKASSSSILFKPYIDGSRSLEMRYSEGSVGIDGATVLRAHQVTVFVEGIGLTTTAITRVPPSATITSVQSDSHGVLVTFPCIVFRAVQTVSSKGITIIFSVIACIVAHL